MAECQPCYRHPRQVWLANCPDCTAWHQARLAAGRAAAGGGTLPRSEDRPSRQPAPEASAA